MFMMISLLCFFFGLLAFVYTKKQVGRTLLCTLWIILLFLGYVGYEVSNYFTGEGVNYGVIYHVLHGNISSAGVAAVYTGLIRTTMLVLLSFTIVLIGLLWFRKKVQARETAFRHAVCLLLVALFTHPLLLNMYGIYRSDTVHAVHLDALRAVTPRTDTPQTKDLTQFAAYFEQQPITRMTNTPHNLVLIYLEGLEHTFSHPDIFGTLTPELDRIAQDAVTFTNVGQLPESSYTIAGMVASQCGIPLIGVSHGNTGEGFVDSYLPRATCLSDVLKQYGYATTYVGGASTIFAGKQTFLQSHGYDTILGKEELEQSYGLGPETNNGWGLYDDSLFSLVTEQFDTLAQTGKPFLLTTLTLDTHPPTGYLSPTCEENGIATHDTIMENAVACTDFLVGQFVDHIRASDVGDHTTIVILSDHLSMQSPVTKRLDTASTRTNRFHILSPNQSPHTHETRGTTIDIGTTILPFIGYRGTIGLGRNLTNAAEQPTTQVIQSLYKTWRADFLSLWAFPTIQHGIYINQPKAMVFVDTQAYHIPAIITIQSDLRSTVGFRTYQAEDALFTLLDAQEPTTISILIDTCLSVARAGIAVTEPTTPGQYCAIGAQGNTIVTPVHPLGDHTFLSQNELVSFFIEPQEQEPL